MNGKVCAQCSKYIGGGDYGLCCKETYALVHEFSETCPKFEQAKKCRNVSSYVGKFRCSICGHYCDEAGVGDTCPGCGEEVAGGIWAGQRHWRHGDGRV